LKEFQCEHPGKAGRWLCRTITHDPFDISSKAVDLLSRTAMALDLGVVFAAQGSASKKR